MKDAIKPNDSGSNTDGDVLPQAVSGQGSDSRTVSFASLPSLERPQNLLQGGSVDEDDQTVISQRPVAPPEEFYRSMPLAELAAKLEGAQLDHFSVEQMVGGGGMGAVFRGVDQRLDRVIAIKVIPSSKRDAETLRRFRLEAQAAARLDHPNIARVYYVGESGQWNYIVFEFIDGINIRDLVEMEGPLSIDDAVYYTRQIAEALQHAHDRDVVHRDIKPSNILITVGGIAKLVDMGLARDTSLDKTNEDATASGITLGTFDYISPEQARNPRDADVRSDLYSLGCTLFYMLTGHPPFPEGTALQKLLNHGSQPPPDPRGWRDDISDELFEVIFKLMAKKAIDRYQKPAELVNDLLLVAEMENLPRSQGPTTLMLSPTVAQRSLLEANLPWMVAFAFLLGSTLWLQSVQSLSNGFVLPELKFQALDSLPGVVTPQDTEADSTSEAGLTRTGSNSRASTQLGAGPKSEFNTVPNSGVPPVSEFPTNPVLPPNQMFSSQSNSSLGGVTNPKPNLQTTGSTTVGGPAVGNPSVNRETADNTVFSNERDGDTSAQSEEIYIVVSEKRPTGVPATQWRSSLSSAFQIVSNTAVPARIEVRGRVAIDTPLALYACRVELVGDPQDPPVFSVLPSLISRGSLVSRGTSGRSVIQVDNAELKVAQAAFVVPVADEVRVGRGRKSEQAISALFGLTGNSSLTMEGCSVTLRPDASILPLATQGSRVPGMETAFSVDSFVREGVGIARTSQATENKSSFCIFEIGSVSNRLGGNAEASVLTTPAEFGWFSMKATNCVFRGTGSLVRVTQAAPMPTDRQELSFQDSLVAMTGEAIQIQGVSGELGSTSFVRFFGDHTTFANRDGFARLEYAGDQAPLLGLNRRCNDCVFWSGAGESHISIYGGSAALLENPNLLLLKGNDNAYDVNVQNICETFADGTGIFDFSFTDGQQEGWLSERGTERVVRWIQSVSEAFPFHTASAEDFSLVEAMAIPGFLNDAITPPNLDLQ